APTGSRGCSPASTAGCWRTGPTPCRPRPGRPAPPPCRPPARRPRGWRAGCRPWPPCPGPWRPSWVWTPGRSGSSATAERGSRAPARVRRPPGAGRSPSASACPNPTERHRRRTNGGARTLTSGSTAVERDGRSTPGRGRVAGAVGGRDVPRDLLAAGVAERRDRAGRDAAPPAPVAEGQGHAAARTIGGPVGGRALHTRRVGDRRGHLADQRARAELAAALVDGGGRGGEPRDRGPAGVGRRGRGRRRRGRW